MIQSICTKALHEHMYMYTCVCVCASERERALPVRGRDACACACNKRTVRLLYGQIAIYEDLRFRSRADSRLSWLRPLWRALIHISNLGTRDRGRGGGRYSDRDLCEAPRRVLVVRPFLTSCTVRTVFAIFFSFPPPSTEFQTYRKNKGVTWCSYEGEILASHKRDRFELRSGTLGGDLSLDTHRRCNDNEFVLLYVLYAIL